MHWFTWLLLLSAAQLSAQAIQPSSIHPQYWTYKGDEILLLGGSIEDNLFQIEGLEEQLDTLAACGGNYVRNTMSSRDSGNLWPFYYDESEEVYDLNQWNDAYWERFSNFLALTAERDIIVQVEIWATFDFYRENWLVNPFNPVNNRNYTQERTDLPAEVPTHPVFTDNPFFWSVPDQHHNIPVLGYQQRFVDKLLSYTLNYDHVLYCMDNETSVTASWGRFWAEYIKKRGAEAGKELQTTEMWDPHSLDHITHRETFDHPELYSFVEISQNNHQQGQDHWDNGLRQIERLRKAGNLRPVNNVKTYGADGGRHGGGTREGIAKFIRSAFFGAASVRFHRPTSGIGLNAEAQAVIRSIRDLSDRMAFFEATPNNGLLSDREANEAYCRASPGKEYAVYFPDGGFVSLEVEMPDQDYTLEWLNVMNSRWTKASFEIRDGKILLKTPGNGDWVAFLSR